MILDRWLDRWNEVEILFDESALYQLVPTARTENNIIILLQMQQIDFKLILSPLSLLHRFRRGISFRLS